MALTTSQIGRLDFSNDRNKAALQAVVARSASHRCQNQLSVPRPEEHLYSGTGATRLPYRSD